MSANRRQLLDAAKITAHSTTRRRSVPTRPKVPVPRSQHQRWRERPRCRARCLTSERPDGVVHAIVGRAACRCLCVQFVQSNRTANTHTCAAQHERRKGPRRSAETDSCMSAVLPENTVVLGAGIELHHHRADDAGAVLGVVNALHFAPTRPVAGPSGIDDASAQHVLAIARWWSIWTAHNAVDANIAQAYLGLITPVPQRHSSGSPHWHPERAFRRRPSGTVWSAPFTTSQPVAGPPRAVTYLHTVGCDPHDPLAALRSQDLAPQRGSVQRAA